MAGLTLERLLWETLLTFQIETKLETEFRAIPVSPSRIGQSIGLSFPHEEGSVKWYNVEASPDFSCLYFRWG